MFMAWYILKTNSMKLRLSFLNILAFAILALALYLNFIYKDSGITDFASTYHTGLTVHNSK